MSKVSGHAGDTGGGAAITGTYDWNDYLKEKRRALDAWGSKLIESVDGVMQGENVVSLYENNK